MKRFMLLVFLCWCAGSLCAQERKQMTRFQGEPISRIEAGWGFVITLRQGTATSATVDIPARLEKQLVFDLDNGRLRLGFKGKVRIQKGEKFTADITCSELKGLNLSGVCSLTAEGDFSGEHMGIILSGASTASWDGEWSGSGRVNIELSGASQMEGGALHAGSLGVSLSANSIMRWVDTWTIGESVTAELSGASQMEGVSLNAGSLEISLSANSIMRWKNTWEIDGAIKAELGGVSQMEGVSLNAGSLGVSLSGNSIMRWDETWTIDKSVTAELSGASQMVGKIINAASINALVSGVSKLAFAGNAEHGTFEIMGASQCALPDFTMKKLSILASGGSSAEVNVTESLEGKMMGASKVNYQGAPETRVQVSGGASLRKK